MECELVPARRNRRIAGRVRGFPLRAVQSGHRDVARVRGGGASGSLAEHDGDDAGQVL